MKSLYCPTAETTAVLWLLQSSVTQNQASLVVGPAGCGKTTAVRALCRTLCTASGTHSKAEQSTNCWELKLPHSPSRMHHVEVDLSSQTTVGTMQRHVRGWFGRKVAAVRRPAGEGSLVAFVDDICMPVPDESGAQPALEVLRQIQVRAARCHLLSSACYVDADAGRSRTYHAFVQDRGGWYDLSDGSWEELLDAVFIASTRPPASVASQRCTRHMTATIYMPMPTEASMRQMFHPIIDSFFSQNFSSEIQDVLPRTVVTAAVEAHACISEQMLPTPTTPQYRFNLHTLAGALQVRRELCLKLHELHGDVLCVLCRIPHHSCSTAIPVPSCHNEGVSTFAGRLGKPLHWLHVANSELQFIPCSFTCSGRAGSP